MMLWVGYMLLVVLIVLVVLGRVPYLMVPRGTAEGRVYYLVVLMVL